MNNVHVYGNYFMASCPWHGRDEHPSLMVHDDGFRCQTCNKFGSLDYLARYIKLGGWGYKVKAAQSKSVVLPTWRRWEQDYGDLLGIARAAHLSMKRYNQSWYFKKRKIDQFIETGYFGYLDGWCTFPVFDANHKVVDIVVRNSRTKQYAVSPSKEHPIYVPSWVRVNENETIYVVYGIVDAWALYACGLPVVTGTSGKSLSASQLKPLDKRFIIVPDRYEEADAYKLAGELGWRAEVLRLAYPDDCKDPDDIRMTQGIDILVSMLEKERIGIG